MLIGLPPLVGTPRQSAAVVIKAIAASHFEDKLPHLLKQSDSLDEVVTIALNHLPSEFTSLLQISIHSLDTLSVLQKAIQANPLFEIVQQVVLDQKGEAAIAHQWNQLNDRDIALQTVDFTEWLTLLLLSCPPSLYKALNSRLKTWFEQIRNPVQLPEPLNREVTRLQEQMSALQEFCSTY